VITEKARDLAAALLSSTDMTKRPDGLAAAKNPLTLDSGFAPEDT